MPEAVLDELIVENLGVIRRAHLELGSGLVVVTGETGAGKTLLLGALGLLAGATARVDRVGPFGEEARVEGRFLHGGGETVAARRVVREGRSRAYLDGQMVPARTLEQTVAAWVETTAQHDQTRLTRSGEVRRLLDQTLDRAGRQSAAAYAAAWERVGELRTALERLGGDRRQLERALDLARHQAREIAAAGFVPGEDRELASRARRLRHADELAEMLAAARQELAGDSWGRIVDRVRRAAKLDPELEGLASAAVGLAELASDLASELRSAHESVGADPAELAAVEGRLAGLGDLRRKYGETLEEVLAYGTEAEAEAERLGQLLAGAESLAADLEHAEGELLRAAAALRRHRQTAATRLEADVGGHLRQLGFAAPVVEVRVEAAQPGRRGGDEVTLLFAADPGIPPGPVDRTASGGELSRLVLAVRLAAGAGEAPLLALDEVDAGVGGATALALGRKLADLARDRQVLCVTHLPQVAAFADVHIVVERAHDGAGAAVVTGDGRVRELARMLAGLPESERGQRHASELLEISGRS